MDTYLSYNGFEWRIMEYPTRHLYFLVYTRAFRNIPWCTTRKHCITNYFTPKHWKYLLSRNSKHRSTWWEEPMQCPCIYNGFPVFSMSCDKSKEWFEIPKTLIFYARKEHNRILKKNFTFGASCCQVAMVPIIWRQKNHGSVIDVVKTTKRISDLRYVFNTCLHVCATYLKGPHFYELS